MMCAPCKDAGAANALGNVERAVELHEGCEYRGSCSCQHGVGGDWHRDSK